MSNHQINISGLDINYQTELVVFPSAIMGVGMEAYLSKINSTFGFGTTPHRFDLEYVPADFNAESLPTIGTQVEFYIDNFLVKGEVKHADYSKSDRGNLINISIEDNRTDLKNYYIDTQGVHGRNDTPEDNLIDVPYWYLKNFVATASGSARQTKVKELESIRKNGASYRQIYDAVNYFENTLGTTTGLLSKLPDPSIIEDQLPGTVDAYRWRFIASNFLDSISKILKDISYDFYWGMAEDKIYVINRKFGISISKTDIPFPNCTAETLNFKYGSDEADKPNKVRLFGGNMEGLLGSGSLIPESGAFNLSYDLGINVGQPTFEAGWEDVTIKYYGPDGELRSYTPTSTELRKALSNIEIWAEHMGLSNRIVTSGWVPNSGFYELEQNPAPGTNVAQIINRYQEQPWVISWYNRVRTFADQHYGKTYILSQSSDLYQYIDDFDVVSQAWCNLENQTSGVFEDGYKIDPTYNMLSPFYDSTTNKMRAFAVFQSGTKWGNLGEASPAPMEQWNENSENQFVPIKISMWKSAKNRFSDSLIDWQKTEKGISLTLPNRVVRLIENDIALIDSYEAASGLNQAFNGSLTSDVQNATSILDPYLKLSPSGNVTPSGQFEPAVFIAIPIKAKRRYGYQYPSVWTSGTGERLKTIIDERYSPWSYEPRGSKNSIQRLQDDVSSFLSSQKIDTSSVTHAESLNIGLPGISFDDFANQQKTLQGYGQINHGITSINTTRGGNSYWQTRYSVKPFFPQIIKAKPVLDEIEEDFSFILHKIEQDISIIQDGLLELPSFTTPEDDGKFTLAPKERAKKSVPVTIIQVYDRITGNPYYLSRDSRGTQYPRALSTNGGSVAARQARATDGLLEVGMNAVYHYEEQEDGSFVQYYTGGVEITDSKVVTIVSDPKEITVSNGSISSDFTVIDVKTIGPSPITLTNVPLLDQNNNQFKLGQKATVISPMSENNIRQYDFTPDANGDSPLFVNNTGGGTSVFVGVVATEPADTGLGGAISVYTSADGQVTYSDGETVDGTKYNIRFVNVDPRSVLSGEPVMAFRFTEADGEGSVRFICMTIGVTFSPLPYQTP